MTPRAVYAAVSLTGNCCIGGMLAMRLYSLSTRIASLLDVLSEGTCSSKVRDILFRLLAKLGRCAIEADVASQLFDLLSDNYARNDQECRWL